MKPLVLESDAVSFGGKCFRLDEEGFLVNPDDWTEDFAEGTAPMADIHERLTASHWGVLHYIRKYFKESGVCPLVYDLCRAQNMRLADLKRLFPTGYLRGACKLAGLTYREERAHESWLPTTKTKRMNSLNEREYRVDIRGFLIDPSEWDEDYAVFKFREMKMSGNLTDQHWRVIRFLRDQYQEVGKVPTVYETCEANGLELEDLAWLFPDGYHRGVVKLAGLKQR
ncbi:MAG: TusE/DsrC/DsvC family sulfur relay protein [Syntrophobacteraceae bacterium]